MKSANGLQGVYIESAKTMDPGDPAEGGSQLNLSLGGSLPWSREAYAFP